MKINRVIQKNENKKSGILFVTIPQNIGFGKGDEVSIEKIKNGKPKRN